MKFIDLIEQIKEGKVEEFLSKNSVDIEYDLIDIYAKDSLLIDSEIQFFNAEEIPNQIIINIEGVKYENVCPLNMLEDLVNDFVNQDSTINAFELANKILSYLEKDA